MDDYLHVAGIDTQARTHPLSRKTTPPLRVTQKLSAPKINLNKFFDLSTEMLCAIGADSYFKHLTPLWENVLGYSCKELKSCSWIDWIHSEDLPKTLSRINDLVILGQEKVTFKNRLRCHNGTYRWLSWKANFDVKANLIYAQVSDLGERPGCSVSSKFISQQFNTPEEHFRLLVDGVSDHAIYMLDKYGRVISWNAGAERINGWTADEIIGESSEVFFPPDSRERGAPKQILAFAATSGRAEFENWRMRKDGSRFWANVTISALRDDRGQLLGYATITRDVSDRKHQEEALQQAYDSLEKRVEERTAELTQANARLREEIYIRRGTEEALRQSKERLKQQASELAQALRELQNAQAQLVQTEKMSGLGQLVAGVAHEINNPVSFIHGNLEHAKRYVEDLVQLIRRYQSHYPQPPTDIQQAIEDIDLDFIVADIPKLLASMNEGTTRIQAIVQSLRQFSRLDEAQYKAVNLHEGLDSALLVMQHRIKGRGNHRSIQVNTEYDKSLPRVACLAGQMNQAFANMISNAIDALREREIESGTDYQPQLTIKTWLEGDRACISILDNGVGMGEDVRSRIFDPFFTTKPVGKGTGLGLSTSYQIIVDQHNGNLSCVSQRLQGTEFTIKLPLTLRCARS